MLYSETTDAFPQIKVTQLRSLPIPPVDTPAAESTHWKVTALVERMLEVHQLQAGARTPTDRELYARQIAATDQQIDALAHELYGLTQEEMAVVEGCQRRLSTDVKSDKRIAHAAPRPIA